MFPGLDLTPHLHQRPVSAPAGPPRRLGFPIRRPPWTVAPPSLPRPCVARRIALTIMGRAEPPRTMKSRLAP